MLTFLDTVLENLKKCRNPSTFLPSTHGEQKERAAGSMAPEITERFYGIYKYNPFLFENTMCIRTAMLLDIAKRRYLEKLQERSKFKTSNLLSEPNIFENFVPPPPPLFADEEILLCDETENVKWNEMFDIVK